MHYFLLKRGATARRSCGTLGPAPFLLHKPFPLLAISPALWRRQRIIPILMLVFSRASTWNYRKHPSPHRHLPKPCHTTPQISFNSYCTIFNRFNNFPASKQTLHSGKARAHQKKKKTEIARPRICVLHVALDTTASKHASL